jgi:hypothetical protein
MRARQAKLQNYQEYHGTDGESSEVENPFENFGNKLVDDTTSQINEEDMMNAEEIGNQLESMHKKMKSSKNLRGFLQGIQLILKFKGLKVNIFAPSKMVVMN